MTDFNNNRAMGWWICAECNKSFGYSPYGGMFCSEACFNTFMFRSINDNKKDEWSERITPEILKEIKSIDNNLPQKIVNAIKEINQKKDE